MFQEMMPMSNGGGSEPIEYDYATVSCLARITTMGYTAGYSSNPEVFSLTYTGQTGNNTRGNTVTVLQKGTYRYIATGTWLNGGYNGITLQINGVSVPSPFGATGNSVSDVVELNANDTIYIQANSNDSDNNHSNCSAALFVEKIG